MKAVVTTSDRPEGLEYRDVPDPAVQPHEVEIAVSAAGVNRADVAQREGRYAQHATARSDGPPVAGLEVAGTVSAVGSEVTGFHLGDEVMSMCSGGYAEKVSVNHRLVLPKPRGMSFDEAAATPVAFITAHDALVTNGRLGKGEAVLVAGGSSVVGLATAQIARLKGAGRVVGTAGGAAKSQQLLDEGFDEVFDYHARDVADLTRFGPFDLVIDMVAGDWTPSLLASLNPRGRLISVGRLRGNNVAFNLDLVARNRLSVIGASFRTRTLDEYAQVVQSFAADLLPYLDDGALRPRVLRSLPLRNARAAQDLMEASTGLGKVVLTVGTS